MFLKNLILLCNKNNTTPNAVCLALGLSPAAATKWRSGAVPRETTLLKIADYFGVTVNYLKGEPDNSTVENISSSILSGMQLNDHEKQLLNAYRDQPEMQPAVDRLLGITEGDYVTVYAAANSASNHKHTITRIPQEKWAEIENEPNTDEDLM